MRICKFLVFVCAVLCGASPCFGQVSTEKVSWTLADRISLKGSYPTDQTEMQYFDGGFWNASGGRLSKWDTSGKQIFNNSIFIPFKRGRLFRSNCDSVLFPAATILRPVADRTVLMINQRNIWTCDARASFYCDRIIGKEEIGHYLDYIDDGRKEMTALTAWTAKPSAIYSPKQGKLIVPLRYEVHPSRAKSKIDLVQRHIRRYRAELFEPDVPLFAVIPMTADDFSLAPVTDKCDYLKHKPFPHNLQPERLDLLNKQ